MNKYFLSLGAAASMLSSCVGPHGSYVGTQINFIGDPVHRVVAELPPRPPITGIVVTPEEYGQSLRDKAYREWREKEDKYESGYTHDSAW